jgi:hypothetical protein
MSQVQFLPSKSSQSTGGCGDWVPGLPAPVTQASVGGGLDWVGLWSGWAVGAGISKGEHWGMTGAQMARKGWLWG